MSSPNTPPAPPASLGAEHGIESMREAINALSTHLRGVSEELATERRERSDERKKGVSILSLHVPLVVILGLVGILTSAGVAAGMFIQNAQHHLDDKDIHADKVKAISGDGIAYNREVDKKIAERASDLEAADRRLVRAVKQGALCAPNPKKKGAIDCAFVDPNSLPLR